MDDLGREDVWIVDPGLGNGGMCHVGVESTVVKVEIYGNMRSKRKGGNDGKVGAVALLRHGDVLAEDIVQQLQRPKWGQDGGTLADRVRIVTNPKTNG